MTILYQRDLKFYISSKSYLSMACFIKVSKHGGDPVKAALYEKMKVAQYSYSELEKSRVASIQFCKKKTKIFESSKSKS